MLVRKGISTLAGSSLLLVQLSVATAVAWATGEPPSAVLAITVGENAALKALHAAAGGANWSRHDNWLVDGAECTWYGITCSADGAHVTRIELESNNLVGSLPSDLLSSLGSLQFFNVGNNRLSGSVPLFAGSTSLQFVNIESNAFSGPIPSLNGLTNLLYLYAGRNQFSGPIPTLSGLTSLTGFDVSGNRITGALPSFDGLPNLAYFIVPDNLLIGTIPLSLSAATKMNQFEVSNNQLTGTIPSLTALTNLSYFYVQGNFLTGAVPAVASPSPLSAASLCPNFLSTAPSANDAAWDHATGLYPDPWWSEHNSRCDILFRDGLGDFD